MWCHKYAPDNKTLTSCRFSVAQVETPTVGQSFGDSGCSQSSTSQIHCATTTAAAFTLTACRWTSTSAGPIYCRCYVLHWSFSIRPFSTRTRCSFFSSPVVVSKKISQNDQVLWALILLRKLHNEGITQRLILFPTNFLQPSILPPFVPPG